MRITILLTLLLFTKVCFAELRVGRLNQNNDHQLWSEQNINIKVNNNLSLTFHTSQRFGDDYKRFWFFRQWSIAHYDVTKAIKAIFCIPEKSLFESFTIGPGFSMVWSIQRNTKGIVHWAHSNRPSIVAIMTHSWKKWVLKQRMFGEYYHFVTSHYRAHAVYRHRAVLNTPWKFTCFNLNPFISNEWFFRKESISHGEVIQSGPFYENRLRLGISADIYPCLETDLWWQLRLNKQLPNNIPLWRKTYQIGITFSISY